MAFKNKDMSVIAYANGFTLWHYRTNEDALQAIIGNCKYFERIYTLMNAGDIIIVNAADTTAQLVVDCVDEQAVTTRRL